MSTDAPKAWRRSVFGAVIETTTGTAVTATGTDGVFNAYNAVLDEESETEDRDGQNAFSLLSPVPNAQGGTSTLYTDVYNDSTAPLWFSRLLTGCGFAIAGSVASPSTGSAETLTLSQWRDGLLKQIAGAQGSVKFIFQYGKLVKAQWNFKGKWVAPTDVANITPTFPTIQPPRFLGATLTVASTALRVSQCEIDVANEVTLRPDPNDATGYHAAFIVGRKITVTMDPEAQPVATVNYFANREAATSAALSLAIGSGTNGIITFAAPSLYHVQPPKDKDRGKIYAHALTFRAARSAAAGDDELTITRS